MKFDYSLKRDTDRMRLIYEELAAHGSAPSGFLTAAANYILYGKDEKGVSPVDRKLVEIKPKYSSFAKKEPLSLDALIEDGLPDEHFHSLQKKTYTSPRQTLSAEDIAIPEIAALRERIEELEQQARAWEANLEIPPTPTSLYHLRHVIVSLKIHQYYMKDAYNPAIQFRSAKNPSPPTIDWTSNPGYAGERLGPEPAWVTLIPRFGRAPTDPSPPPEAPNFTLVARQKFDDENPLHIRYLLDLYSDIYMELWDKPDSYGRCLLFDLDRYVAMTPLTKWEYRLLERKIDKWGYDRILRELEQDFGIIRSTDFLTKFYTKELPRRIAEAATAHRIRQEVPERKTCRVCGRELPPHEFFFSHNCGRKDGWESRCKECDRKARSKTLPKPAKEEPPSPLAGTATLFSPEVSL